MRGLKYEFARFREICLHGQNEKQIEAARNIFFAGAGAQTARMLGILDADLPITRKAALIRRLANEMEAFKREVKKAGAAHGE